MIDDPPATARKIAVILATGNRIAWTKDSSYDSKLTEQVCLVPQTLKEVCQYFRLQKGFERKLLVFASDVVPDGLFPAHWSDLRPSVTILMFISIC